MTDREHPSCKNCLWRGPAWLKGATDCVHEHGVLSQGHMEHFTGRPTWHEPTYKAIVTMRSEGAICGPNGKLYVNRKHLLPTETPRERRWRLLRMLAFRVRGGSGGMAVGGALMVGMACAFWLGSGTFGVFEAVYVGAGVGFMFPWLSSKALTRNRDYTNLLP